MASGAIAEKMPDIQVSPATTSPPSEVYPESAILGASVTSWDGRPKARGSTEGTDPSAGLQVMAQSFLEADSAKCGYIGRFPMNGRTQPNRLVRNASKDTFTQAPDSRIASSAGIDPLSQHIFKRTHASSMLSAQQQQPSSGALSEATNTPEPTPSSRTSSEPTATRTDSFGPSTKDKKKGVKFLSRFIGSKKKDPYPESNDGDSQPGDQRMEGTDADVFSQPVGSNGFIPRFPAPPKYIKMRSHGKKEKDFNRIFLAQQLRGRTGVEIAQAGGRHVKVDAYKGGDPKKDGNAIWAMEFSRDGRYLAAGGQDYLVRVWTVISNTEERRAHETEEDAAGREGEHVRLNAPVFRTKPAQEYEGHTASVLDLSWSKNNFLLSSSMDKTVRLWHASRVECLCCFKHSDFVTSVQFHPRDDRFFLAGSLDSKLRLWSIPDKSVAYWDQLPDLITAVAFSPDGKAAIAGCLNGLCLFYETEGLKYQTQVHVKSAHGKNAKGSKITGIQAITFPPEDPTGEVKLLVTSNDSRVRVYNLRDKGLEMKLKGNENSCSQIRASFSEDAKYIICGSEDRKAYIWPTGPLEVENAKRPVEVFEAHSAIVTTAIMAPTRTRQLLGASGDPLYELCNPPAVTLISRSESHSSRAPTDHDNPDPSTQTTPAISASEFDNSSNRPEESAAYIARSTHPNGNIIVTADYMGHIKVFRQDCAYQKRLRSDANFSRKMLGRTNSIATRHSNRSGRDSLISISQHPSSDRIISWRQSITNNNNASLDSFRNPPNRSNSPRKSVIAGHGSPALHHSSNSNSHRASIPTTASSSHRSSDETKPIIADTTVDVIRPSEVDRQYPHLKAETNPLMLQGDQSYMFWNQTAYRAQAATANQNHVAYHSNHNKSLHRRSANTSIDGTTASSQNSIDEEGGGMLGVPVTRDLSTVSALSSEEEDGARREDGGGGEMQCRRCKGGTFRAREGGKILVCGACGEVV